MSEERFQPSIDAGGSLYCKYFTKDGSRIPCKLIEEGYIYYIDAECKKFGIDRKTAIKSESLLIGISKMLWDDLSKVGWVFTEDILCSTAERALMPHSIVSNFRY